MSNYCIGEVHPGFYKSHCKEINIYLDGREIWTVSDESLIRYGIDGYIKQYAIHKDFNSEENALEILMIVWNKFVDAGLL